MCKGILFLHLSRFEKCKDVGMILTTNRTKRGHKGLLDNTAPSDCERELGPFQPSSTILLKFSSEEYVKIQSIKTLWNIQCEINPISLQLIFPLIDLAIGGGQNTNDIVHQHTKVLNFTPFEKTVSLMLRYTRTGGLSSVLASWRNSPGSHLRRDGRSWGDTG